MERHFRESDALRNGHWSSTYQHNRRARHILTNQPYQLIEGIFNPRIHLEPHVLQLLQPQGSTPVRRSHQPPGPEIHPKYKPLSSMKLENLAKLKDLIGQPELYPLEIMTAYEQLRADCRMLRTLLFVTSDSTPTYLIATLSSNIKTWNTHNNFLRPYGVLLSFAPILNSLLRVFSPNDIQLAADLVWFTDETMLLTDYALPFRPLGASYVPLPLISIWAATDNIALQAKIEEIVEDFEKDYHICRWMLGAYWLRKKYETLRFYLAMQSLESTVDGNTGVPEKIQDDDDTHEQPCSVQ